MILRNLAVAATAAAVLVGGGVALARAPGQATTAAPPTASQLQQLNQKLAAQAQSAEQALQQLQSQEQALQSTVTSLQAQAAAYSAEIQAMQQRAGRQRSYGGDGGGG